MNWFGPSVKFEKHTKTLSTTVTYLEMFERPDNHVQRPANINAALLVAKDMPLHFYRYLYFNVGIHWNWEMRLRLKDDELARAIHDPNVEITVLYLDGAPAGFYEVNRNGIDVNDLAYFGMMPHGAGRGLGRWFLSSAIDACWSGKPSRITVNTCTLDHPAALPLYQKMGFKPYRQSEGYVRPLSRSECANLAVQNGITGA
ncbi:GNAT family N-acetyltransferase [Ahrensia marina]|uniref:Acetyltransferase n=1 Tax=Ahrensia marina TaxID=1514904 RepID=A0A0M9GNC9_9HYPH|nr:GNAT family N-acetyltransferase [Ahrensia marina]KPB01526.1 acetyltransferase [Ahrensia marina]